MGLQTKVESVSAVATGQSLPFHWSPDGNLSVSRPKVIDPVSTAIAVHLVDVPKVSEPEYRVAPQSGGSLVLLPSTVDLAGSSIQVQGSGPEMNIGYWTDAHDKAQWKVQIPVGAPSDYHVSLAYSCEPGSEGSSFMIQVDGVDTKVGGTVTKTASWEDFQTITLDGTLTLTPGPHTISVVPKLKPGLAVMNLKSLTLK